MYVKQRNSKKMPVEDTELINQAQRGNMDAFEQLVQKYDKQVLTIAAGYVSSSDDAKDIYQEVFIRVYRGLNKFRHKSEFSTWLYRIATNVCLSHRSRQKKFLHTSIDQNMNRDDGETYTLRDKLPGHLETDRRAHDSEISTRIEQALAKLSPRQRMVFTLKHYEGYKIREIANMMKCGEGTVKKYLFEAIARLQKQLKDFEN